MSSPATPTRCATDIDTADFGRIRVATVPLPDEARSPSGTYSYSGKVLVLHRTGDPDDRDYYALSVVEDDGSGFRTIFAGVVPQHPKANGVRHLPFADNRRILFGDHILECTPDIDACAHAELVPVEYPWNLKEDPLTSHHWSEVIVSPDNEHVAWTILRSDMGSVAARGRLRRLDDRYAIEDPALISSTEEFVDDPDHPGSVRPAVVRGGEVKQFVRGGRAISAVGNGGGMLPDSVLQSLDSDQLIAVTRRPGYDETTMFSPDETVGLVMTSRASTSTDPAVLGLLPRPLAAISGRGLSWAAYMYTVDGVRRFRAGNVGPVLIDVARSSVEPDYLGVCLADPDQQWVYCSPMSWHPSGRKVMWMETLRGSHQPGGHAQMRIRTAELLDHEPAEHVAVEPAPDAVPYGVTASDAVRFLRRPPAGEHSVRVAGRHSGHAEVVLRPGHVSGTAAQTSVRYEYFSDDGRTFYTGTEHVTASFSTGTVYLADLEATGDDEGEMHLRMSWSGISEGTRLLFDEGDDGFPRSHGYARYGSERRNVADLVP